MRIADWKSADQNLFSIRNPYSQIARVIMVRVMLPQHLQVLASAPREATLDVAGVVSTKSILDALEARYPTLRGTIREHVTLKRRPLVRFYALQEDVTHDPPDAPLPEAIATGAEPFFIIGAIAGG